MSNIPFNRVVNVEVSVSDRFATVANFSVPLIMASVLDQPAQLGIDLVRTFSDLESVALAGYPTDGPTYATVQAMLATNTAPRTFKIGYNDGSLVDDLRAIADKDSLFYGVVLVEPQGFADAATLVAANEFLIETRRVLFFDTNDTPLLDSPTPLDSLGKELQALQPSRLAGFFIDTEGVLPDDGAVPDLSEIRQFYAAKAAAFVSNVNYNQPNSHYTLKFVQLDGALPNNIGATAAQNITGFLPATGQNPEAGAHLNAYVCTAGINYLVEGTMTDGTFIDLVTFSDWLVATMQQNILSVFTNTRVVPYDLTGVAMVYSAIGRTLDSAVTSGAATENRTDDNGDFLPAYEIAVQAIPDVAPALQSQRISPNYEYCLRYTGAQHYVDVRGIVKTAN